MKRLLAVLVVAGLVQAPAAAGWSWPVDGPVLRPFVLGSDPYAAGQHRGLDIGAAPGTIVRAATDGSVSFVGTVPAGGRAVTVRTAGGLSVTYLELGATRVERGALVADGDPIGTIGPASHVHLGVRVTADAQGYLDPLQFLPARVTGPARADPVPEPQAAVAQPEPDVEAVEQAELPATETTAKPKPEPEPVVPAPSPPVASAAPTPAPAATDSAPVPVPAETTPVATAVESGDPRREQVRASDHQTEPSRAGATRTPERVRNAPASHRGHPSRAASPPSRRQGATRTRGRVVDVPPPAAHVKPEAATPRAGKGRAIEPPFEARRPARQSDSERTVAPVLLLALLLLGVAGAITLVLHRRRRGESARPRLVGKCSLGRMRPPRLLHACARAGEPGWLATATRSRSLIAMHRPLPRPRRRVPLDARV